MVALKPILTVICTILLSSVESWKYLNWRPVKEFFGLETNDDDGVCFQTKYRMLNAMNVTYINPVRTDRNCQRSCDYKNQTVIHEYLYYEDVELDVCCSQYYLSKNRKRCIKCNVECQNAWCSSSNTCECEVGYTKDRTDPFTCYPARCNSICINGICSSDDLCICKKNYIPDPEDKYSCIPICKAGFQRNPNDKNQCERGCYPPCAINAACEAGECVCNGGYDNVNNSCVPRCRPCDSGKICVAPHTCSCPRGFIEDNQGTCIPKCIPDCNEGACTAPDVCTPFCTIECQSGGQCRIQEKCLFDKTVIAAHNRETCFNPELCLINCKCNNRDCICDLTVTSTTNSVTDATTIVPTLFEHQPYSSLPDLRTRIGDMSDLNAPTNSSNVVVGAAVAVILILGIAAAAGIVIRKRSKTAGRRIISNDIYRMQNPPGINAIDIDNEIYEETNEYQEIEEK